jgi:hypothetical protein
MFAVLFLHDPEPSSFALILVKRGNFHAPGKLSRSAPWPDLSLAGRDAGVVVLSGA